MMSPLSRWSRGHIRSTVPGPRRAPGLGRGWLCFAVFLCLAWALPGATQNNVPALTAASTTFITGGVEQPEFLPVEEAYPLAVEQEGESALRLVWQMPPGYYLYQHAFRFELRRGDTVLDAEPAYPPSIVREDEYFGRVSVFYDSADITLNAASAVAGSELRVTSQGCADAGLCYPPRTQVFRVASDGGVMEVASAAPRRAAQTTPPVPDGSLGRILLMMVLAFAGGMILNLMPCVLPILSLKVVGFACAPEAERHRHGLLYSAGVVTSFLLVAGLLFALRGAGQAIGWGFQLQSPTFVIALAYLFVLLGLGLSGAIALGNGFVNMGSSLADQGGATGSFFTGVLAVVVASPCTAPLMGTALGFALVQPPLVGLCVFFALGAGMAAPMLLLSYSELARRWMPKPGAWMERLKQALAFPLYATALWLFWVAGRQAGVDLMGAALLGALLLALGVWLWRGAWLARSFATLCIALALGIATWRPTAGPDGGALPEGAVAYSSEGLDTLRARGEPVFVDVTADWCITCLANERSVLSSQKVRDAFAQSGVTYMVADWTDYDADIADFVTSHGRSGIPLYVLYDGSRTPMILPQLLRTQVVLDALGGLPGARVASTGIE